MRSDQLIAAIRQQLMIPDAAQYPEWSDAKLLRELNDKLRSVFTDIVTKARAGHWLQQATYITVAGKPQYRIPPRAVVQGLEAVELLSGTRWIPLDEIPLAEARQYDPGQQGTPQRYWVHGDQVHLVPTPPAGHTIRLHYYLRPSELATSQSSTLGGAAADRGRITTINTGSRQLTVNALPWDYALSSPAAITSATQLIDVLHPDGWAECALVGASQTISGSVITVGGTQDLSEIQEGDYVRVAGQTDWPQLAEEFHRLLADVAAVKVAIALSLEEKAATLSQSNGPDLERFRSTLTPRTKSSPKRVPLRLYGYR